MRKYSAMQKVLAVVLTLVMVIGLLPNITMPAKAAGEQAVLTATGKVADPDTLNNWEAYYGNASDLPDGGTGVSTWKAGGVWTDKSVFTSGAELKSAASNAPAVSVGNNNFLISLSALASNQEIVGQSTAPSDTVLVLDLSQSMDRSESVDDMVKAANETIDALLKMNTNNRVGVVLYSGNTSSSNPAYTSSATVILPLDHYTTTTTTTEREWVNGQWTQVTKYQYLTYTSQDETDRNEQADIDTTVSVAAGTRNSDNKRPNGSKKTTGGTYIQNGLFQAWEEFEDMTDKGVVQSGPQVGTQRTPILILMSDGAPTIATTDYYNVGTSNTGNGMNTTNQITFLTQLTAAWTKGKIGAHYNNTAAKFYTIGLGTANSQDATAVLSPGTASGNTLRDYWTNFNRGSTDGREVTISGSGNNAWKLIYQSVAETVGRNYVDQYWAASNADDMINAFKEIVDEIGLQSAYSATLVQSGDADLDGYITIEDELGAMMEVKNVKGIWLGNKLFTGVEVAKSMDEGLLGQSSNPKDYGNEFVRTVKERLGITDTSVAQNLIRSAYHSGQLSYTSNTEYSNYIGWYGDADNNYLGFWEESYGYGMESAPAGAVYINKSYGYLGGTAADEGAADMMHVVVMVHTEITTGHQTVLFKVPSSLIPMITYKVELDGEELAENETATLSVDESDPIRLLYEVGLPDDVNNVNLEQKVAAYEAASGRKVHQDNDGNYVFYANSWDTNNDGVAPDISELSDAQKQAITAYLPESHFIPNTANERFYILEDSVVYGSNHQPVSSKPAAGSGPYYFVRYVVTDSNLDGKGTVDAQYELLQDATIRNAQFEQVNGQWVIKAGTIRQHLSNLELEKSDNTTDTIGYSDSLWVYVPQSTAANYNVYSFLGNNGKLTVTPATGIKVTKNVTEVADGAEADEKFEIVVELNANVLAPVVTDADGNLLDCESKVTLGKTYVTLNLANGESAYITGVPAGTGYTVTEADNKNYTYTYTGATKTVAGTIVEGVVTNEPVKDGGLYITKEVVHANGGTSFPTDYEFEFEVTFVDKNGDPIANTEFKLENNYDPTITARSTDEKGVMTGWLRHGETVHILGVPAGAVVTVEEVNIPANYTSTTYRSRNQSGAADDNDGVVTIVSEANATVVVTNTYTPNKVDVDLSFAGTKNFDATNMAEDSQFTFKLQEYKNGVWTDVDGAVVTVTGGTNASETFAFNPMQLEFTEPDVHSYQIVEVKGENSDITYDRSVYTFSVNVTLDSNGDLQTEVVGYNQVPGLFEVTGDAANGYEVTTVFNNQYHTTATSVEIKKSVDDKGNTGKNAAGFVIETYEASVDANGVWTLGDFIRSTVTDAQGEAMLVRNYDNTDFEQNDTDNDNVVTYHFVIKEKNEGVAGWIYDATEYRLTVVLSRDDAGVITADFNAVKVDAQGNTTDLNISGNTAAITFANTYDPDDGEVNLNLVPTVVKELKGRDLVAGEFTFAIFKDGKAAFDDKGNLTNIGDAIATGTNDAQGNVTFTPGKLTFSEVGKYEYDVIEVKGDKGGVSYDATIYDLVIEVTDAGDGTLKASYYFEDSTTNQVAFQNTYTAEPAEATIDGLKTIQVNSGSKTLAAGEFTFGLYEGDVKIDETTNRANGTFSFDTIPYTEPGDHTYTIKEIAPDGTTDGSYSSKGLSWSGQTFTVTVKVEDNGTGALEATVTGNGKDNIEFVNTYASAPASVSLPGTKTLDNRDLVEGEFHFQIYTTDKDFAERTAKGEPVTHDGDGNITFNLGSLGMGYHYFVIKEVIPEERAAGIGYDAGEYQITVQVIDAGEGQMSALVSTYHPGSPNAVNPAIAFKNTYTVDGGQIVIDGSKTLLGGKNLTDGEFTFELYEGTNKLGSADVTAAGTFAFDAIEYTAEDVGKTFTYTVKEAIPTDAVDNGDGTWTKGQYIYDGTVFTVEVTVNDNVKDGELEITKTVNGSASTAIAFENTFVPTPITHALQATKSYNKPLKDGQFEFTLKSADDKTDVDQKKSNNAEGEVFFDAITFSAAGEYKFTVTEKTDGILSFIRPSEAEYEVTITVINTNGVLSVSSVTVVKTKGENIEESNLTFINNYILDGEGQIAIRGTKALTGDRTTVQAGEFAFGLYDAEGKLVESVKNDASGNFAFSLLPFDEEDTEVNGENQYTYTVKEIAGEDPYVTYDASVFDVVVTVKDDDEGGIDVSYTLAKGGKAVEAIAFTNTFVSPDPVTVTIDVTKTVENKTEPGITAEDFEIQLYEGETLRASAKTGATGKAGFQITYGLEDVGKTVTYKVMEKKGKVTGVTYDETVYSVKVTVAAKEDGSLYTIINDVETDTALVTFKNIYEKPATPVTGDNFPVFLAGGLLLISAAAIVVLLLTKKQKKGGKYAN